MIRYDCDGALYRLFSRIMSNLWLSAIFFFKLFIVFIALVVFACEHVCAGVVNDLGDVVFLHDIS